MKYSAVTPVRDESGNLPRLAESLAAQTIRPTRWLIIDTGSTDDTVGLATRLAEQHPWIAFQEGRAAVGADRGWPVVRAVQDGFGVLLAEHPDVVAKLDADVSFGPDFFERVLQQFDDDPALGIAGGVCHELHGDVWRPRPVTAEAHVWGATRAYRRECLADVLPLEPRLGFEAVDELKAALAGWSTRTILDVPFFHHRREGERDGARWRAWAAEGDLAHYMTYRPSVGLPPDGESVCDSIQVQPPSSLATSARSLAGSRAVATMGCVGCYGSSSARGTYAPAYGRPGGSNPGAATSR